MFLLQFNFAVKPVAVFAFVYTFPPLQQERLTYFRDITEAQIEALNCRWKSTFEVVFGSIITAIQRIRLIMFFISITKSPEKTITNTSFISLTSTVCVISV